MKEKYLVFTIQAYQQETPQGGLLDLCVLELIDTSYEEADKRARIIVKKKFYRLSRVFENFKEKA